MADAPAFDPESFFGVQRDDQGNITALSPSAQWTPNPQGTPTSDPGLIQSVVNLYPELVRKGQQAVSKVGDAAQAAIAPPAAAATTQPTDYTAQIRAAAQQAGVNPDLAVAIARHGEGFGHYTAPNAVSPKGAVGVMQIMPANASGVDLTDPSQNITRGVQILKGLSDRYKGDPALIAAAYNAGPSAVDSHGGVPPYPETKAYVDRVQGALQPSDDELQKAFASGGAQAAPSGEPSDDDLQAAYAKAFPQATPGASAAPAGPAPTVAPSAPKGAMGALDSAVRAAADAVSGGFANKIAAAGDALPKITQGVDAFGRQYSANLTAEQQQDALDRAAHPWLSGTSGFAGALAQGLALPELKAATWGGRFLQGAKQGAALASVDALGHARGGALQEAESVPLAAGIGMLTGGGLATALGPRAATVNALEDYARAGVDPMLAVNGGRSFQQVGQTLKGLPVVGGPLAEGAERTTAQLAAGAARTANALGGSTGADQAGGALQRGVQEATRRMRGISNSLYAPVNALEKNPTPIQLTETDKAINDLFAKYPTIPGWLAQQAPKLAQVRDAIQQGKGALTFGEIKAIRSDIGRLINDKLMVGGIDQANLKTLYGAMSDDMAQGAEQIGGASARKALSRADNYYSAMNQRIEDALETTWQAPSREAAYNRIIAAAEGGQRADVIKVQQLKRSLSPDAWNELTAGYINQLGKDAEGNFSPARFATKLSKLTPAGRTLLFGRGATAEDMIALQNVAKLQAGASKFYNHSNSGHALMTGAALEAAGTAAGSLLMHGNVGPAESAAVSMATLGTMGWMGSKLLASPGFARAMLKAARYPEDAQTALSRYATNNPTVAPLVTTFQTKLASALDAAANDNTTARKVPVKLSESRFRGGSPVSLSAAQSPPGTPNALAGY